MKKLLFLLPLLAASACSAGVATDKATWTEEVRLRDGSVVQVHRTAEANKNGFPNPRGSQVVSTFSYAPLGLTWALQGSEKLLSFDIIDGKAYLVLLASKTECAPDGRTRYKARYWAGGKGAFKEVREAEVPLLEMTANLYGRYWGNRAEEDAAGLVTLRQKFVRDTTRRDAPLTNFFEDRGFVCAKT